MFFLNQSLRHFACFVPFKMGLFQVTGKSEIIPPARFVAKPELTTARSDP
jgi:hypothetical protein